MCCANLKNQARYDGSNSTRFLFFVGATLHWWERLASQGAAVCGYKRFLGMCSCKAGSPTFRSIFTLQLRHNVPFARLQSLVSSSLIVPLVRLPARAKHRPRNRPHQAQRLGMRTFPFFSLQVDVKQSLKIWALGQGVLQQALLTMAL